MKKCSAILVWYNVVSSIVVWSAAVKSLVLWYRCAILSVLHTVTCNSGAVVAYVHCRVCSSLVQFP